MNLLISCGTILLFLLIKPSESCNGYEMIVNHIRNCKGNNVIKVQNMTSELDENCIITTNGCLSITGFKTAKLKYTVSKPPLPIIRGNADFCADPKNDPPELAAMMASVNIPRSCPQKASTKCFNKIKTDIQKKKHLVRALEGTSLMQFNFDHGNRKSCINVSVTVKKQ